MCPAITPTNLYVPVPCHTRRPFICEFDKKAKRRPPPPEDKKKRRGGYPDRDDYDYGGRFDDEL